MKKPRHKNLPGLRIRVILQCGAALGPGKADLLQQVDIHRSISAAARALGMSYRRAWSLIDDANKLFGSPVVLATAGGTSGGHAALTELGHQVLTAYRRIESGAAAAVAAELEQLRALKDNYVAGRATLEKLRIDEE